MDPAPLRLMADETRQPEDGPGSRRRFLRRATFGGIAAVGATALPMSVLTAAAQTDDTTDDTAGDTSTDAAEGGAEGGSGEGCLTEAFAQGADVELVQHLESLSRAAGEAYEAVIEARLLTALESETAHAFERNHLAQADLLYCAAGGTPVEANPTLASEVAEQISASTDEESLLAVLVDMEDRLAATATAAVEEAESSDVAALIGSIAPVISQQATVWAIFAHSEPAESMPAFQTTDGAFTVDEYPLG